MAHQDYVSRKKTKSNPYKKAPEGQHPLASFKTKLIILIATVAIVVFSYFLWSIKDKTDPTPEVQTQTTVKQHIALPEKPQNGFSFRDDLKNKEVEASTYEVIDKGPYQMQCASFRNRDDAETMRAKIAFNGISSQIKKAEGSSWYRVILGPYKRKRQAEADKHKLKSNNINTCQIWLWR